jgi:hypothetical protein
MAQFKGNQIDFVNEQIKRYKQLLAIGDLKNRDLYRREIARLQAGLNGPGVVPKTKAAADKVAAEREKEVKEDVIETKQDLVDAILGEDLDNIKEEITEANDTNRVEDKKIFVKSDVSEFDEEEDIKKLTKPELIKLAQLKTKDPDLLKVVCKTKASLIKFLTDK